VFVVKASVSPDKSQYVGSYQNEGFGKVIYNPAFLKAEADGVARYRLQEPSRKGDDGKENKVSSNSALFNYLMQQQKRENLEVAVYEMVNKWVKDNSLKFTKNKDLFASQWGGVRSIAMKNNTKETLVDKLYKNEKSYLTHGVAADKWNENGRLKVFKEFVEKLTDENAQIAIINLAAEMAKVCRKEGK
jgi:hypothetical protein